jgi:hypothetical protein
VEKIRTHILRSITFFPFENHAAYEIVWKNIVEPDRPQRPIWRMRFTCWMNRALSLSIYTHTHAHTRTHIRTHTHVHTHTHRICNTYCFSRTTMVTRTLLSVTLYLHCLSFFSVLFSYSVSNELYLIILWKRDRGHRD